MLNRNTELRKVPAGKLSNIANILEIDKDWRKFVPIIPKNPHSQERKYNCEEIQLMKNYAIQTQRKYAEVLFDEWGTSGKVRPTLGTLMDLLQQAQLIRAVEAVARMIGEPPPPRPANGPGALVTTSLTAIQNDESMEQRLNSIGTIPSVNLNNSGHDNILCANTTKQMKEDDLIEFSKTASLHIQPNFNPYYLDQPSTSTSENVPNLTDMISESITYENIPPSSYSTEISSINNTESNTTDASSQNESTQNDISQFYPNVYSPPSNEHMDIYDVIDLAILDDKKLLPFGYKELEAITNKFSYIFDPKGLVGKIGSGGFGDVYVGTHKTYGTLAVKRVRDFYQISSDRSTVMKIFNTEVKSLSYLRHTNIVPILGYSIDGPTPCLVCKYVDGGSLLQKIAAKVLTEQERINIMTGTAAGLHYIHHSERPQQTDEVLEEIEYHLEKKSYYLHGDIKSANILLTKNCVPMLCDFGLAKQLDTTIITKAVMGTSAYMSPEGFSGTITQKNDIFSFGIVLLELLTGYPPVIVTGSEQINIKGFVEDCCPDNDITRLLDRTVKKWTKADEIFELANNCLNPDKKFRPSIDDVCNTLNDINISVK